MHTQASELRTEKEIEKKEKTIHEISHVYVYIYTHTYIYIP
jgi:hypothetical protein